VLPHRIALGLSAALVLAACNGKISSTGPGDEGPPFTPTSPQEVPDSGTPVSAEPMLPGTVSNLAVSAVIFDGATLAFTAVDDGTGQPARYDIRFATPTISFASAASVTKGTCASASGALGTTVSCTVTGLAPTTKYQFQLIAYRGTLNQDAVLGALSNIAETTTTTPSTGGEERCKELGGNCVCSEPLNTTDLPFFSAWYNRHHDGICDPASNE
jgi:hypothetical protein